MAKRKGRPIKAPVPGRNSLGLRVSAEIKDKLRTAALVSGRSMSQEAEMILERALSKHDRLFQQDDGWYTLHETSHDQDD